MPNIIFSLGKIHDLYRYATLRRGVKKLKCFFFSTPIDSKQATTTMLSFLKSGDINNSIKGLTSLPGMTTADGDKIKYALLNHSMAMRKNLSDGTPIFTNIRQLEADIENRDIASITSGRLPSMAENAAAAAAACHRPSVSSLFTDSEIRIDNAALAFIMAKELAFLNRTIQMISLIAARYQEEQDDAVWGCGGGDRDNADDNADDSESGDDANNDDDDLELGRGYGDDGNHAILYRSQSHGDNNAPSTVTNQLSATFLIASCRLRQRIDSLCELTGTNTILMNGMTMMDRPRNQASYPEKPLLAQHLIVSDILLHFGKFDAEHRDPVVLAFLELRDISVSAWQIISMFAFSNLFRLTEGTDFKFYRPEDAIFTQGREYCLPRQEAAAVRWGVAARSDTAEAAQPQQEEEAVEYD